MANLVKGIALASDLIVGGTTEEESRSRREKSDDRDQSEAYCMDDKRLQQKMPGKAAVSVGDSGATISISDAFDGGNIKFIGTRPNELDPTSTVDVILHIKPDNYTELEKIGHMQYFSFRSTVSGMEPGSRPLKMNYIIENAEACSYPEAWPGSTVCFSTNWDDVDSWQRNESTVYTDGKLCWDHLHAKNGSVFFSYFPPFSYSRHLGLVSRSQQAPTCTMMSLGQSLDGREIECLKVGTGSTVAWIIHRQHPGENMAEHFAEGLLIRLLGLDTGYEVDDDVKKILTMYTFYIVPCMCPDGVVRGHLRTNACGANLNREWHTKRFYKAPTLERSPEVYGVLKKMDETGVDVFLDVHGDEELPVNFISGAEKTPKWGKRMESLHGAFVASFKRANPDFQQEVGYPSPDSEEAALKYMNVATNQVANRFDCLGMTLEMPFKDCLTNPDPLRGWSPRRARDLGASVLGPFEYVHQYLRAEGEFWTNLPSEDAYVDPTDDYEALLRKDGGFVPLGALKSKRFYSDVHQAHPSKQNGSFAVPNAK